MSIAGRLERKRAEQRGKSERAGDRGEGNTEKEKDVKREPQGEGTRIHSVARQPLVYKVLAWARRRAPLPPPSSARLDAAESWGGPPLRCSRRISTVDAALSEPTLTSRCCRPSYWPRKGSVGPGARIASDRPLSGSQARPQPGFVQIPPNTSCAPLVPTAHMMCIPLAIPPAFTSAEPALELRFHARRSLNADGGHGRGIAGPGARVAPLLRLRPERTKRTPDWRSRPCPAHWPAAPHLPGGEKKGGPHSERPAPNVRRSESTHVRNAISNLGAVGFSLVANHNADKKFHIRLPFSINRRVFRSRASQKRDCQKIAPPRCIFCLAQCTPRFGRISVEEREYVVFVCHRG